MSYLALARQWRPRTFQELLGQTHVTRPLEKSLSLGRLHHAYLFTGAHGLGKTSIARILTKAINCERGITAKPCLACEHCKAIEEGHFLDLIEIDAASKTRVEDTRDDILATIAYAPVTGRKKVYLIDEVHMLSQHSFNALLKTLEEPPEHVVFILATTDVHKIPETIRSRCLNFHLNPITDVLIATQLKQILTHENAEAHDEALALIAKASEGSMRDALGLLDQALAASENTTIDEKTVRGLLGYARKEYPVALLSALANQDGPCLIKLSRNLAEEGGYYTHVLDELLEHLHQIALHQIIEDIPLSPVLIKLAKQFCPEEIQLFYHIVLKGKTELTLAPAMTAGFEMILLKMLAFKPKAPVSPPKIDTTDIVKIRCPSVSIETVQEQSKPAISSHVSPTVNKKETSLSAETWLTFIEKLPLRGLAQTAMEHTTFHKKEGAKLFLYASKTQQTLFTSSIIKRIEEVLSLHFKETLILDLTFKDGLTTPACEKEKQTKIREQHATDALNQDEKLQTILREFSGELVQSSIQSMDPS